MNKYLDTIVIVPMTTNVKEYPTRVAVTQDGKKGILAIDQIRTADKKKNWKNFWKIK